MRAALIERTFEVAAGRIEDLTPLVYARLFAEQPQMEALFCLDANHQVRGEMLSQVIRSILDFVGERQYAATLIQTEVMTHAGYDVPPAVFGTFFGVVAATLREVLGQDWSPEIDAAWRELLVELDYYVTHPDQSETARAALS
ncbi:globin domain-containing protein [Caulobacter sp.]|uniref:globin domain-containing protein n=1 Tax=Caulobacter sp. TaxID=78 RepID=UPI003BAD15CC